MPHEGPCVPYPSAAQSGCLKCGRPIEPVPEPLYDGGRNPAFEREFIAGAQRLAQTNNGWAGDVVDRLTRMEREKGTDSYRDTTLRHLITEADEEGLDLGGWTMLAALLAYRDIEDDERRQHFQILLQQVAAKGAEVRTLCDQLRDLLN